MRQTPFSAALAGISVFGFAVRVTYVELFSSHIRFGLDTTWYHLVSQTVASGRGFLDPGKYFGEHVSVPTAFRPPLYPVFLAVVTRLFDTSAHTLQIAGCLGGVLTIAMIGYLGRRVGGPAVGLVAAALASVYPIFLAVDASLMSETLYVPLVTGAVLSVYRAIERPSIPRWLLVGALTGACVLTRGDGLVLLVVLVVPAVWLAAPVPWDRRALLAAASIAACGLVLVPWTARNERRLGVGTVATLQSGTALAGSNCAATYYGERVGSWSYACTERPDQAHLSEARFNSELRRDGRRYLLDHAERLLVVVPVRILRQWGLFDPVEQARIDAIESRNMSWQIFSWIAYLPVAALAVYGFVLLRARRVLVLPMLAVVAAVTISAAVVYGGQRFRSSVEPILVVAAAVAVVHLAGRLRAAPVPMKETAATL